MFRVTDKAAQELKRIKNTANVPAGKCLRLKRTSTGELNLGVDSGRPGDQVISCKETKVMVLGEDLSAQLESMIMDVQVSESQAEFLLSYQHSYPWEGGERIGT